MIKSYDSINYFHQQIPLALFPKYTQSLISISLPTLCTPGSSCLPDLTSRSWGPSWFSPCTPPSSCCSFFAVCAPSFLRAFVLVLPVLLCSYPHTHYIISSKSGLKCYFWGRPSLFAFPKIATLTHTHILLISCSISPLSIYTTLVYYVFYLMDLSPLAIINLARARIFLSCSLLYSQHR